MDSSLIVPLITGSGVAGVFCVLFILGLIFPRSIVTDLKAELTEVKRDRDLQRDRADTAVAGNASTRDILEAIRLGRDLSSGDNSRAAPERAHPHPGATP